MSALKVFILLFVIGSAKSQLKLFKKVVTMEVGERETFLLNIGLTYDKPTKTIKLKCENDELLQVIPKYVGDVNSNGTVLHITIKSLKPGKSGIFINSTWLEATNKTSESTYLVVEMYKSKTLEDLSSVMGWGYFLAWSVSFYPQIFKNFKRESCEGLSFDYNFYNLFGYGVYNMFNVGMYFSKTVQDQFSAKYPNSINPVHFNDIVYSIHSFVVTVIIIAQCWYYKIKGQHLSKLAIGLLLLYTIFTYVLLLAGFGDGVSWLRILYICSYLKFSICFTKSFPQIVMNLKNESSRGCSIGSIVLDLIGGFLSVAQMILDSVNYEDWICIYGNPSKLGIAVASVVFATIFALQHFFIWDKRFKLRTKPEVNNCPVNETGQENHISCSSPETIPHSVGNGAILQLDRFSNITEL